MAYSDYKGQRLVHMTRIEMLIALYEKAMEHTQTAIDAQSEPLQAEQCFRAMRIVTHLQAGLDKNYGEIPDQVERLLEFANHLLLSGETNKLSDALSILSQLKSAFDSILIESIELERQGHIPALQEEVVVEETA